MIDDPMRNPTLEAARKLFPEPRGGWKDRLEPLAALHRARMNWLDATDEMLEESDRWLSERGYPRGEVYLTPEERDEMRERLGLGPLS